MEEKKELNLSDAQLEEIAGGLNKQQIKDAAGKVIKFGKNNVKEILLATTAVTGVATLAMAMNSNKKIDKTRKKLHKLSKSTDERFDTVGKMFDAGFGVNVVEDEDEEY